MARTINNRFRKNSCLPLWRRALVWPLQIAVASEFFILGCSKLMGAEEMVMLFSIIGLDQRFLYLTGSLEILSAVLILFSERAFWGGLILSTLMIVAMFIHWVLIGDGLVHAFKLFCMTATVTWIRRPLHLQKRLTT